MSSARALLCGVLGAFLVTIGLAAQDVRDTVGPIEKQAKPITPENPIPRRTFSVAPVYPTDAQGIQASGSVSLAATLDETGRVVEIRKVREPLVLSPTRSDPTALRIAADGMVRESAAALRRWTYDPPASGPVSFLVTFSFKPGGETTNAQSATVPPGPVGFSAAAAAAAGGVPNAPVRVGGSIKAPTQISKINPVYPAEALAAGVSGVVILEAVIGVDGRVTDAKVLRSIPQLDQAAVDAVRQWVYTPTMLNGVPVPVIMTVTVMFTLQSPSSPPPLPQ